LTLSSVAGETCCGVLMARETVIIDTPAACATSRTVTLARSGEREGESADGMRDGCIKKGVENGGVQLASSLTADVRLAGRMVSGFVRMAKRLRREIF